MKFRWKLLTLLLAISIVPVVSLRTFGIHNVHRMAEALLSQVKGKQIDDAEHRLQLLLKDYAKAVRTTREQVEMALFYQTMEAGRLLQTQWTEHNQSKSSRASDFPDTGADEMIPTTNTIMSGSLKNSEPAWWVSRQSPRCPECRRARLWL